MEIYESPAERIGWGMKNKIDNYARNQRKQ